MNSSFVPFEQVWRELWPSEHSGVRGATFRDPGYAVPWEHPALFFITFRSHLRLRCSWAFRNREAKSHLVHIPMVLWRVGPETVEPKEERSESVNRRIRPEGTPGKYDRNGGILLGNESPPTGGGAFYTKSIMALTILDSGGAALDSSGLPFADRFEGKPGRIASGHDGGVSIFRSWGGPPEGHDHAKGCPRAWATFIPKEATFRTHPDQG
jgi:hypothetical protein